MKKGKRILSAFLALIMVMGIMPLSGIGFLNAKAYGVSNYCATAAASWAESHWNDYDSVLFGKGYWDDGGDCACYVSQCLYMGGMDMTAYWNTAGYFAHFGNYYGSDYSGSFIRVPQLYNYLVNQGAQAIYNPSASDVEVGDVLIFRETSSTRWCHSAIVVAIENGTPVITYHTVGTKRNRTSDWHLGFSGSNTCLLKLYGTKCVNNNPRHFDVYIAGSGDTRMYVTTSTQKGYYNSFLSGEYAHVYKTANANGITWGYTFRYGYWGWIRLSNFSYKRHVDSADVSHTFGEWVLLSTADCITDGVEQRTCTRCGYVEKHETLKGGHVTKTHATCTEPGYCSICGEKTEEPTGHNWSKKVIKAATCLEGGMDEYVCLNDASHNYKKETSALGHSYQAVVKSPTCVDNGTTTYKCARCGDTYVQYVDENNKWSGWTTQKLNLPADKIQSKTQYSYRDKSTKTSYNTSETGWTRNGGSWVNKGQSSIDYVETWPSGFSKSDSNYTKYHNSPKTNSQTETTKITVNSTTTVGYLYYHWCYKLASDVGEGNRLIGFYYNEPLTISNDSSGTKTEYATEFESCVLSYVAPVNYGCFEIHGYSKYSYWWTGWGSDRSGCDAVPIKRCTYTTYNMLFNYYKWSDWSAWQDTAVSASSTREVNTRTVYRYNLAALGHDFTVSTNKAATCTEDGYSGYDCSRCGAHSPDGKVIKALGHSLGNWYQVSKDSSGITYRRDCQRSGCDYYEIKTDNSCIFCPVKTVAPTCIEKGYTVYKCSVHGEVKNDDYVDPIGHDWNDGKRVKDPTCTEEGTILYTCENDYTHIMTESIHENGHTLSCHNALEPTCTEGGNSEYYECSVCKKYFGDEDGSDELEQNAWVISPLGHKNASEVDWTLVSENACGKAGLECKYCDRVCRGKKCGCLLEEKEIQEITPDYYVKSAENAELREGEWVPTHCNKEGILHYTCRNCEGTVNEHGFIETIGSAEHTWGEWIETEKSVCIYPGHKERVCSGCGIKEEDIITPSYDHHNLATKHVDSSCLDGGYEYKYCTNPGCTYTEGLEELSPTGHNCILDPESSYPATCTEKGLDVYRCQNEGCGYFYTVEIDALGHGEIEYVDYDESVHKCYCSRCKEFLYDEVHDFSYDAETHTCICGRGRSGADYTEVNRLIAEANKINMAHRTEKTVEILKKAIDSVVRGLPKTEQYKVDEMADRIRKALNGLTVIKYNVTVPDDMGCTVTQTLCKDKSSDYYIATVSIKEKNGINEKGQYFVYWVDQNNNILSPFSTYSFYATKDIEVTPVYVLRKNYLKERKKALIISRMVGLFANSDDSYSIVAEYAISKDAQISVNGRGIIYTVEEDNKDQLIYGNDNVGNRVAKKTAVGSSGVLEAKIKTDSSALWARPYIIDSNGKIYYGEVVEYALNGGSIGTDSDAIMLNSIEPELLQSEEIVQSEQSLTEEKESENTETPDKTETTETTENTVATEKSPASESNWLTEVYRFFISVISWIVSLFGWKI